jgi:hypothetical protein
MNNPYRRADHRPYIFSAPPEPAKPSAAPPPSAMSEQITSATDDPDMIDKAETAIAELRAIADRLEATFLPTFGQAAMPGREKLCAELDVWLHRNRNSHTHSRDLLTRCRAELKGTR